MGKASPSQAQRYSRGPTPVPSPRGGSKQHPRDAELGAREQRPGSRSGTTGSTVGSPTGVEHHQVESAAHPGHTSRRKLPPRSARCPAAPTLRSGLPAPRGTRRGRDPPTLRPDQSPLPLTSTLRASSTRARDLGAFPPPLPTSRAHAHPKERWDGYFASRRGGLGTCPGGWVGVWVGACLPSTSGVLPPACLPARVL